MSTKIIAVTGGSGSGKTTLAKKIQKALANEGSVILGQDSYYIDQSKKFDKDGGAVNFDHPNALEFSLMAFHIELLKAGQNIEVPIYDFATHTRMAKKETIENCPYVIIDGTLVLSQEILLPLFDEAIFLEVDEDTRYQRRLKRDVEERGRTPEGVHDQFYKQVRTMHDEFVEGSKGSATLLLSHRPTALELKVQKKNETILQSELIKIIRKF
jgi:uridine kinase